MNKTLVTSITVKVVGSPVIKETSVRVTLDVTSRILSIEEGAKTRIYPLENVEWFEYER
jgi:hypothetical protein